MKSATGAHGTHRKRRRRATYTAVLALPMISAGCAYPKRKAFRSPTHGQFNRGVTGALLLF